MADAQQTDVVLPRIAITFCTQCKWLLRAAYFGQELLSTFGTSIGEIALIPATGGIFTVYLTTKTEHLLIWNRKDQGGFPETKILKQLIRNHIEPEKKLGHSDTPSSKPSRLSGTPDDSAAKSTSIASESNGDANSDSLEASVRSTTINGALPRADANGENCEDCK
ncbi:hypothetical protein LTR97_007565 [Elasticomyces elasticus]|uniref:Selenoprotein W-like protein n=1 Tax=Elasticomyces elasticus TaxID=574655 RepID=A0AAN7W525_9PEZI|nr:hypothetical protein LTR97_007565 [Elasticomyces elasticus]KAK5715554.1 hypothetical protein LTR15_010199 [Elasticomyces elasticus]